MQKQVLTEGQTKFIAAALKLLNQDGLEQLTLRNLAKELEVKAPAVYWHFKNKSELIDYMAEAILQEEFADMKMREESEEWQSWLKNHIRRLRRAMLRYRDGGRVVAGAHLYPAVTLFNFTQTAFDSLFSAGIPLEKNHTTVLTAVHFTFGRVIEEQSGPSVETLSNLNFEEIFKRIPNFERIMSYTMQRSPDANFENSLDLIIR